MLFNSLEYAVFLCVVFLLFWGFVRLRLMRVLLLLAASYVFYMSWNATFIFLIVASTVIDYFIGLALGRTEHPGYRKALVGVSLLGNLGALGLFKYADFFIAAASQGLSKVGVHTEPGMLNLVLPVGISFYTFQTLSYTIDVYRRKIPPHHSFIEFATFVAFFPQLVAGPIVRASEFLPQFANRPRLSSTRASEGLFLIVVGLIKKVLVADFLAANLIDRVFEEPGAFSSTEVIVAVYAYSWQLYGDFSGYTDIARGSARLFGFDLPENFDRPYQCTGPIDFWRRWHMTLSRWVQDYLYVPLGGSQISRGRTYVNLFITFFVIGIWHGAGWTFVIFGLWHATGVAINRVYRDWRGERRRELTGWRRAAVVFVAFHFFVAQWPVFRSPTVTRMWEVYGQMFEGSLYPIRISPWVWLVIALAFIVHYTPKRWVGVVRDTLVRLPVVVQVVLIAAVTALITYVGRQQAAPFIYFQF
ncbi:MAG: MBOAT family O-acyltransferase [Myxococcota bacterium]